MKKTALLFSLMCLFSIASHAQLMVARMVGKDAARFGTGYGVFTYLDFPLRSGNESFRIELMDLAFFVK